MSMNPDPFESDLKKLRALKLPEDWREGILRAVREAQKPEPESERSSARQPWWRELLWPCPQAWAGLAAVWAVIFVVQAREPALGPLEARNREATFLQFAEERSQMNQMFGTVSAPVADRPPRNSSRPRSERTTGARWV